MSDLSMSAVPTSGPTRRPFGPIRRVPSHHALELAEVARLLGDARSLLDLHALSAAQAALTAAQAQVREMVRQSTTAATDHREAVASIAPAASVEHRTPGGAMPPMQPLPRAFLTVPSAGSSPADRAARSRDAGIVPRVNLLGPARRRDLWFVRVAAVGSVLVLLMGIVLAVRADAATLRAGTPVAFEWTFHGQAAIGSRSFSTTTGTVVVRATVLPCPRQQQFRVRLDRHRWWGWESATAWQTFHCVGVAWFPGVPAGEYRFLLQVGQNYPGQRYDGYGTTTFMAAS